MPSLFKQHKVKLTATVMVTYLAIGLSPVYLLAQEKHPQDKLPPAPVEVQAMVDRAVSTTGDIITYTVEVIHDGNVEIYFPDPGSKIAGFRITDLGGDDNTRTKEGRYIERHWYKLRADLVGSYVLPSIRIAYRKKDKEGNEEKRKEASNPHLQDVKEVTTSEIFIEVQSVLPIDGEVKDIRDIKKLVELKQPTQWLYYYLSAAVMMLLFFVLYRRQFRNKLAPPPPPPHEIAFTDLNQLRETNFDDLVAVRIFYFKISGIVRRYCEAIFKFNATDMTTEEISMILKGDHPTHAIPHMKEDEIKRLKLFLCASDDVKFADKKSSQSEIEHDYEAALSFVENTHRYHMERAAQNATEERD